MASKRLRLGVLPDPRSNDGQECLLPGSGGANTPLNRGFVEPMTGIEPAYSAWEADVLPLNYIGAVAPEG
jgi:hypothetical protein